METTQSNLVAALHRLPLFTDLTESELALIAQRVTVHRFDAGVSIFSEVDPCQELLIVKEGSVKLLKTAANGRQQLLSVERAGNALSEISVFDGNPYPATANKLAREEGRRTPKGIEFELIENNEQLAARLGTVRELVSRNLGRLHNEGLIQMSRRKVAVPDPGVLAKETD